MHEGIKELKHYMSRYYRAAQNLKILEERLEAVQARKIEEYAREVEEEIRLQERGAAAAMAEIVEMTALLPPDSLERVILELRHIDCKPWRIIQKTVHLTPSPCFARYKKGLELLLEQEKIRARLGLPLPGK